MKNLIMALILSMTAVSAMTQVTLLQPTQRGNFVIGSRIGFSTAKSSVDVQSTTGSIKGDGGSSAQFNLSPGIGYFFAQNFVVGISMDWLKTNSSTGVDLNGGTLAPQKSENNNVLFGPFVRYFFPTGEDKAFFLGTTVGFGNSKNQFVSNNTTQTINNSLLTIGVGPGFTIYSKNGLALEALVKYNFARSNSEINVQDVNRISKTWTNAVDFSVGIQYYFGGFKAALK
ncbi:outer membrane beta-barrel protein [Haliscomenobacter sp.]|uniref:outer membrane beta-barrel protein n=1 Tax=Haliscomenobacter sp. TaxID=2717303 RepID=UPI003364EEE8